MEEEDDDQWLYSSITNDCIFLSHQLLLLVDRVTRRAAILPPTLITSTLNTL